MYNIPVNSIMSTHRRDLRVILVEILGGFWDSQAYTKPKKSHIECRCLLHYLSACLIQLIKLLLENKEHLCTGLAFEALFWVASQ